MNDYRKKKLTHPYGAQWEPGVFDFIPSPLGIKKAWIQERWFSQMRVYQLLGLLTSQIKLLFLAPTLHLLIHWPVMWQAEPAWTQ